MPASREYALERLDQWYADRMEKGYSDELMKRIEVDLTLFLEGDNELRERLSPMMEIVRSKLSKESQVREAQSYFTNAYASLEGMIEGVSVNGHTLDKFPEGVRNEYIQPLEEGFEKMRDFVCRIRRRASKNQGAKVTNEEVNQEFSETFQDHGGFTMFCQRYMRSLLPMMDLQVRAGTINQEQFEIARDLTQVLGEVAIPIMSEAVFGDIEAH